MRRTRRIGIQVLAAALVLLCLAGCGNVYLRGEALTAAETSAMDAFWAAQRAGAEPDAPAWQKAYLAENFKQWRSFVRSARKDEDWGPTLQDEAPAAPEGE